MLVSSLTKRFLSQQFKTSSSSLSTSSLSSLSSLASSLSSLAAWNHASRRHNHVGVIGIGAVGASCVSSLIHKDSVLKVSVYDIDEKRCLGEVLDLQDEAFIKGTHVQQSTLEGLRECDIIIMNAGVQMKVGQTRADTLPITAKIARETIARLLPLKPSTILMIVSNPVDVLANYVYEQTKAMLPSNQVLGTGTYLDTQRLRVALSKRLDYQPSCIHAYVIGEHDNSQVAPMSLVRVGGCSIDQLGVSKEEFHQIARRTAVQGYTISDLKGRTNHGIGESAATICDAIFSDHKSVLVVSTYHPKYGMYLGWPVRIGRNGVESLMPIQLTEEEEQALKKSTDIIAANNALMRSLV